MIDPTLLRKIERMERDVERALLADMPYRRGTWVPTPIGGYSPQPSVNMARYLLSGKLCFVSLNIAGTGSSSTALTVPAPFPSVNVSGGYWGATWWDGWDNGSQLSTPGRAYIASNSSTIIVDKTVSGGLWTASGYKAVVFSLIYEVA